MLLRLLFLCSSLNLLGFGQALAQTNPLTTLSQQDYQWIGQRIFQNEANQDPRYLTYWSAGEEFPSFGIGHFIWLPASAKRAGITFVETFPEMVSYVSHYHKPPQWLLQLNPFVAPWQTKVEFDQARSQVELTALRQWLVQTQDFQARFIVESLQAKWAEKMQTIPESQRMKLQTQMHRLQLTRAGVFATVDYYNFKGLGLTSQERYQGEGWGLADVLLHMPMQQYSSDQTVLEQFVMTAKQLLEQRVKHAPSSRDEQRWLKGWFKRLDGYLQR